MHVFFRSLICIHCGLSIIYLGCWSPEVFPLRDAHNSYALCVIVPASMKVDGMPTLNNKCCEDEPPIHRMISCRDGYTRCVSTVVCSRAVSGAINQMSQTTALSFDASFSYNWLTVTEISELSPSLSSLYHRHVRSLTKWQNATWS